MLHYRSYQDATSSLLLLHAGVSRDLFPLGDVGRDHPADFRGRPNVDLRALGSEPPLGFRELEYGRDLGVQSVDDGAGVLPVVAHAHQIAAW